MARPLIPFTNSYIDDDRYKYSLSMRHKEIMVYHDNISFYDTHGNNIECEDATPGCSYVFNNSWQKGREGMLKANEPFLANLKVIGLITNGSNNTNIFGLVDDDKFCYSMYASDFAYLVKNEDIINSHVTATFKYVAKGAYNAIALYN